jgi:hypothetical protein
LTADEEELEGGGCAARGVEGAKSNVASGSPSETGVPQDGQKREEPEITVAQLTQAAMN